MVQNTTPAPGPVVDFIHSFGLNDAPEVLRHHAHRALLDTLGVAVGGAGTTLSGIIRTHASRSFGGPLPLLFDDRTASLPGVGLAGGMTIDALDAHDGFNLAKGHIGAAVIPALFGLAAQTGADSHQVIEALVLGYELGARLGPVLHDTAPDYHTSGAWMAVAVAGVAARLMRLDPTQTAHALGIAEFHGPRSQMMRCIDHPTMVKDGAGWGAMTGLSAAELAQLGFTGAPALTTLDHPLWSDLGHNWLIGQQYFKPVPVCRWAQPALVAVEALRQTHRFDPDQIAAVTIEAFHEATRLATAAPQTTEEAQYSTCFPVAAALIRGPLGPRDVEGAALHDPDVLRLSHAITFVEDAQANQAFPATRLARVTLKLRDGSILKSDWHEPTWDAGAPPSDAELSAKFHRFAQAAGPRADQIERGCRIVVDGGPLSSLTQALYAPLPDTNRAARPGNSA